MGAITGGAGGAEMVLTGCGATRVAGAGGSGGVGATGAGAAGTGGVRLSITGWLDTGGDGGKGAPGVLPTSGGTKGVVLFAIYLSVREITNTVKQRVS